MTIQEKLTALAEKAIWAAAAGSMTELTPDDVRLLKEAASALTRPPGGSERLLLPERKTSARAGEAWIRTQAWNECLAEVERLNASPQGAEQRQEGKPFGHYFRDASGHQHFHTGANPPSFAQSEIIPLYATPHPAPAASQGDVPDPDSRNFKAGFAAGQATERALSSPPGVQAAQVSDKESASNWCRTCGKYRRDPAAIFCNDSIHSAAHGGEVSNA